MWKMVIDKHCFPYVHFKAFRVLSKSTNAPPDCKFTSSHKT